MAPFLRIFLATAFANSRNCENHHRRACNAINHDGFSLSSRVVMAAASSTNEEEEEEVPRASSSSETIDKIIGGGDEEEEGVDDSSSDLSNLCKLFRATPTNLLSLRTNPTTKIRGIYVNSDVQENDIILKLPLISCLRDDSPPDWLLQQLEESSDDEDDVNDDGNAYYSVSVEGWVTRLAASLLDAQLQYLNNNNCSNENNDAMKTWLTLLPTNLREILPIHWGEDSDDDKNNMLACAGSRSLEAACESAYFARSGPIGDIMASLKESTDPNHQKVSQRQVEDALDLVQTRSCRAESSTDGGTPYMRVLVPIFDMINHNHDHNAEFFREGEFMVVLAKKNINANKEIFINYGVASTRPAWKCLFSYGFVPLSEDIYEDDAAEILIADDDGKRIMRVEVGPTDIPFELVSYEAEKLGQFKEGEELEFNAEIGQKIVDRITCVAKESEDETKTLSSTTSSSSHVAFQAIKDLRESNRRTLLACAGGLKEYLEDM